MKLSAMQEAMLLDGARSVSDERRDEYFAAVAEALREESNALGGVNKNATVKRPVTHARWKCGVGGEDKIALAG
jgi:hypothetical protein